MAEDIQEEWKELNEEGWCNYIRKEWIIVVQIPLAVIGGILVAVLGGHAFWSFVYWSHAITASVIVALNVFLQLQNVFKKFIFKKFMPDFMTKVLPVVYSLIYTALYGICAIISFVSFAISGVLIYVLFVLCLVDLYFKYRAYKSGSDGDDAESATSGK